MLVQCLVHAHECLGDWLVAGQTHKFVELPHFFSRPL
jgi:hypothetical protein